MALLAARVAAARVAAAARAGPTRARRCAATSPSSTPQASATALYDEPELYERAFCDDRDFFEETHFLLSLAERRLGRRPRSLLELGCGPAAHAIEAARSGLAVSAVDLSPAMVRHARSRAAAAGVSVNVVQGDMRDAGGVDGAFDAIAIMFDSMSHLLLNDDIIACLAACRARLAPNGVVLLELKHPLDVLSVAEVLRAARTSWSPATWDARFDGGELAIEWGRKGDHLDVVTQVLHRTVAARLYTVDGADPPQRVLTRVFENVVPTRLVTVPEMQLLARAAGLRLAGLHGGVAPGLAIEAGQPDSVFEGGGTSALFELTAA